MSCKIVSFNPYIVVMDILIELPQLVMATALYVGPFHVLDDADVWSSAVVTLHSQALIAEEKLSLLATQETGFALRPYIQTKIKEMTIQQVDISERNSAMLIAPEAPEEIVRWLNVHGLSTAFESIVSGVNYMETHLGQKG